MAGAATLERVHVFQERPPEAEIYGRSLSTPYKCGAYVAYIVGKYGSEMISSVEVVHSPEAEQARAEFYTSVEEGFGTDEKLGGGLEVRLFDRRPVVDGKVMSRDRKTAISDMTAAGLVNARAKFKREAARGDYRFGFQLTRSEWDHPTALVCDTMVRGETDFNTFMVVTPFCEEAELQCGSTYVQDIGYVPPYKRGFVQMYHAGKKGFLSASLSFDGSNKERLRGIFRRRGREIPETETTDNWLKYAITGNFTEEEARALALELANEAGDPKYKKSSNTVEITCEHRKIMDMAFNESYIPACESLARGYQTPGVRGLIFRLANNARSFNGRYSSALYRMRANPNVFTDDDMIVLHELLVYSTIEMMRALHIRASRPSKSERSQFHDYGISDVAYMGSLSRGAFQSMLSNFAAEGARNNRTYSACGLAISPGDGTPDSAGNPQYAFGGYGDGEIDPFKFNDEDEYGSLEFDCPHCHRTNRRPRHKLISNCQKCDADVTC